MNLVGPGAVAVSAGFQRPQFGPASVAIQDHGNVVGFSEPLNFFEDATAVEAVEQSFTHEIPKPLHRTTVVLSFSLGYCLQQRLEFLGSGHKVKA